MKTLTLIPAYGRDYTSARKVKEDWDAGKDFLISDFFNPYDGKPMNKEDAECDGNIDKVGIRYNKLTKQTLISVERKVENGG